MNPIARRTIAALTTALLVVCLVLLAPPAAFPYCFAVLFLLASFECWQLVARRVAPISLRGLAVLLPCLAVLALAFTALPLIAGRHGAVMMLYVIAIVKISDMGGFAAGLSSAKLMKGGNHKLCPTISPNKSWEGLGGSVLGSCLLSLAFLPITHYCWPKAVAFGLVAALVGTAGDLVESKLKRWAGVKDSATFMPAGMGGLLDMFDSLLFVPLILIPFL